MRARRLTAYRLARLAVLWLMPSVLLAACSLEPPYHRPDASVPTSFKEALQTSVDSGTWKVGEPADAAQRGRWWMVFGDSTLNGYEDDAQAADQDLKAATARVAEARALVRDARAQYFPTLDAGFGPTRQRLSPASQFAAPNANVPTQTLWRAQGTVAYEADLFGQVSSNVNASTADAQQSEALFRSVQLALQADVAQNYFQLRQLDAEQQIYRKTVSLRENSLRLAERRYAEGDINELDVSRARSEVATARAAAVGVARLRAASEHGLAILLGKPPAEFSFPETPLEPVSVQVPPGLPSALLERRPDIAAAERAMAAANARVGLARSAYFPRLNITGQFGYESNTLGDLFMWSSRAFLLGPLVGTALTMPIFDGGRRDAELAQARSRYEEQVATYRQQVLVAFREVEDNLSDLRLWMTKPASKTSRSMLRSEHRISQVSSTRKGKSVFSTL